ncbi:MAG: peptidylprolyl isomerase [Methanobacteriota archaeon]
MPAPAKPPLDASNPTFTIVTNAGTMKGQLFAKQAPNTVANFASYAKENFFAGIIFHRVIKGFVIQGGGFTKDGKQKRGRSPIKLEIAPDLKHWDGALSMARTSDPTSATSQFFVCHGPQPMLDKQYAVFGVVTEGLDVVDKIASGPTDRSERPKTDYVIESLTVSGA